MKYQNLISRFKGKNILVLGDLILDQYIIGHVSRISPEAPVPVVLQHESFYTPGGAANVANNLRSLKAKVTMLGRLGPDAEAKILVKELKKRGIDTQYLVTEKDVPTPLKTRIIAQHQQMVRIDREKKDSPLTKSSYDFISKILLKNIKKYDGIIVSDYGKGMIVPELIDFVCSLANKYKKIIVVDPKVEHFNFYRRATCITPNRQEAENAIRNIKITQRQGSRLAIHSDKLKSDDDVKLAGRELVKFLDLESLLITLGEHGMFLFERGQQPVHIKTRAKEVFDVTGAGDTVVATFALALASGATKAQAADLANFAAGVVVGKMGAVAITGEELINAIKEG